MVSVAEKVTEVKGNLELTAREMFFDSLAEKVSEFARLLLELGIEAELTEFLGYFPYQRKGIKDDARNGSYRRDLVTRLGLLEGIKVARDRAGKFHPTLLPRYQSKEEAVTQRMFEIFISGAATRKMKKLTKKLFGKGYSAGTMSNVNKLLTEEVNRWLNGPIEDDIIYVFIDGLFLPIRRRTVSKESLLVAVGITRAGKRKFLAMQLGNRESAPVWKEFLGDIKKRGLQGKFLQLGIMDGLPALEEAFKEVFPCAQTQRCIVHKLRNISAKVPRKLQAEVMIGAKEVFYAKDKKEALARFSDWKQTWQKLVPGAVTCLEKDLESVLRFYDFPKEHWIRIRTTNVIERMFREFRRRVRQMDALQGEEAALRILYALGMEINARWNCRRLAGFYDLAMPEENVRDGDAE